VPTIGLDCLSADQICTILAQSPSRPIHQIGSHEPRSLATTPSSGPSIEFQQPIGARGCCPNWESTRLAAHLDGFGSAPLERATVSFAIRSRSEGQPDPGQRRARPFVSVTLFIVALAVPAVAEFVAVCGDATGDGEVTVTDGVQILRAAAFLPNTCSTNVCDADGNGTVTVTDAVNVLRVAAGLPASLVCDSPTPTAPTPTPACAAQPDLCGNNRVDLGETCDPPGSFCELLQLGPACIPATPGPSATPPPPGICSVQCQCVRPTPVP
jgi:hypothetical protein